MMQRPWDCAQPDEWLPQSLRLCWGSGDSSDGGGGFGGDSSGGGWDGGGYTGGGDWGSAGSYDASGFDADGAWGGTAYDASYMGQPAGGGGDWGSFGDTNYSGFNAPNPTFEDVGGPNAGVTTGGGGDWGSAGAFSAAGTGGGPGGAMFGAAQGAASGLWGGGDTGGGGLFGDYGGGGGGGSYGGGGGYYGGGGGQGGGGSFGGFGTTGTLGGSNAIAAAPTGPTGSTFADTYGGGSVSGSAGPAAASSHSMGGQAAEAAASDAGPSESEAAPSEDTSAAPSESQFGEPSEPDAAPTAPEAEPEAEPAQQDSFASRFDAVAPAQQDTFASRFDAATPDAEPSAFGPQSLDAQAAGEQGKAGQQQDTFDSRFGFETAPQQDSFDSRFGFDVAAPQDTFDSRFGFDTSAPAPAIEASIPAGRETDFGYGPGPQTAPPNFNQAFEAFNAPGWDLSEQTAGVTGLAEPTDWAGNPYQPSTDVSVGRDFNQVFADVNGQLTNYEGAPYADMGPPTPGPDFDQSFQAFDTPTGMDLASDFATGRTTDLSNQLGLNDLTVGPGLPTGPAFGISGLNLNPLTHDDQVVNVDIVPAPPDVQPPPDQPQALPEVQVQPTPQEVQPQQPQEVQPAPPQEAQPQEAQPQEAQPAPPQEAQPAPPQQVEQTQPQEAQPAPPSLIEQAQTLPAEVQPTAPPSLIEQAQPMPGAPLSFPGTLTPQVQPTEAPQQAQQAQPSAPMPQSRPADAPVTVGPFVALPGKQATGLEANIPANPTTGMPAMKGIDTTNNGKNGGPLGKVEAIITHFSGGKGYTIGALVSQMMKGGAGYNIAVDKDGTAYQLRPDGVTAGHVGDRGKPSGKGNFAGYFNNNSIGVAALAENEADLTPAQIATMKAIVTALGKANNLPPSQVFGHAAVDSNRGEGEGSTVAGWAKGLAGWPSQQPSTRVVDVPRPPADIPPTANLPPPTTPPAPGRPPADIPAPGRLTFYAPGGKGKEGGYATSRPNPQTGKNTPSTLDDVRLGKSDFVTVAADPRRYGESVNLGTINYRSPIDGKTYTLPNVRGIVHDTGSAFKGKLDKLDVAVGDFRGWNSGKAQAFVANNSRQQAATPTATNLPPPALTPPTAQLQPPADVPAALPPPTMPLAPETRPPADIPVTLTPPRAGRADPVMQTRAAQNILAQATAHLTTKSGEAEFTAASVVGAKAMAAAGIPLAMARSLMTEGAYAGAAKAGYGPSSMFWGIAKGKIDAGIDAGLQGYQPAKPGAVQGPPSPFAPGKQGAAPFGQRYASMSQLLGEPAPEEDLGREGDVSAREAIRPWDIMPLEQLSPMIAPPAPREPPYQPPPGPVYTPGGPGMFNPFRGNEAALPLDTRFLAKGGHVDKDEPVVVGEEGPETFVPDQPGTVVPHMPQPGKGKNVDRWPKMPAVLYPGRYGGVEREIERQTRAAQDPVPSLIDLIDSGRLPLNAANWDRLINNPDLIALGRSRFEDRREGIDPGAEQYGAFIAPPAPAAEPPDPTSPMAQALGYGSIKRRPMQIGRQSY